jgi:hypothetical protein
MVVGASGHQSIPASGIPEISERLRAELQRVAALEGICSLAAGADQLFARLVLEAEGSLRVIVPSQDYETTFTRLTDRNAYDQLLRRAASVEQLQFSAPSEQAFFAAGKRIVDECDRLLAIWDGEPSRGFGGTADVVRYAHERGIDVCVIWPKGLAR